MILVTGLPRTGSMSVSQALTDLGYKTLFYCPLTLQGEDWIGEDISNYDVLVDWSIVGIMEPFLQSVKVEKIIFLSRSPASWIASVDNLVTDKSMSKFYMRDFNESLDKN